MLLFSIFALLFQPSIVNCKHPVPRPHGEISTRQGRIVGGSEATPHSWRFMASLQHHNGFHFCGGALLTPTWVLTAAHCVEHTAPSSMRVVLGEHSLYITEGTEQIINVSSIHVSPFYNLQHPDFSYYIPYDLALIELDTAAVTTTYVTTVDLPSACSDFTWQLCTAIGWGRTDPTDDTNLESEFLQETQLSVIPLDSCRNVWGDFVYYGSVCVFTYGTTPCSGDSGGPLICIEGGRYVLAGVSSWGDELCGNHPTIYSKVSENLGWIHDITKM